jgi:hypothetical protein
MSLAERLLVLATYDAGSCAMCEDGPGCRCACDEYDCHCPSGDGCVHEEETWL